MAQESELDAKLLPASGDMSRQPQLFHTSVATEELITTTTMPRYSICCSPNVLGPPPKTPPSS